MQPESFFKAWACRDKVFKVTTTAPRVKHETVIATFENKEVQDAYELSVLRSQNVTEGLMQQIKGFELAIILTNNSLNTEISE